MKKLKLEIEKLIEINIKFFNKSSEFRKNWSKELKLSFSNFIDVNEEIILLIYYIEKSYDVKFLYKYLKLFNKILQEKIENDNQDSKLYQEFYNFLRDYQKQAKFQNSIYYYYIWMRLPELEFLFFMKHSFDFIYILGFDILFSIYDTIWIFYHKEREDHEISQ